MSRLRGRGSITVEARAGFAPFFKTIGSAILGRVTYDHAVAQHGYGSFGEMPSYVVTHRPFGPPAPAIVPFTGDLAELVGQIRMRHSGDIWLTAPTITIGNNANLDASADHGFSAGDITLSAVDHIGTSYLSIGKTSTRLTR